MSRGTAKTRAQTHRQAGSVCVRVLVLLGYVAVGIGAVCLLLGAALIAGAVGVGVVVRGLARPVAVRVAARLSVPSAATGGRATSAESVRVKSAPRVAG